MLAAEDAAAGVQARLLLIPLGQQAAGSLNADDQLLLASHFLGGGGGGGGGDAQDVAKVMAQSAGRSPSVVSVERIGAARERTGANGRKYVSFAYDVQRCVGERDEGSCLGELSSRRTLSSLTVSPITQFRTNTERARMQELGQTREVNVLWLLTLSAPKARFDEKMLASIANTFVVPKAAGEP
jgi:hypothetical protein